MVSNHVLCFFKSPVSLVIGLGDLSLSFLYDLVNRAEKKLFENQKQDKSIAQKLEGAKEESAEMVKAASKRAQLRSDEIIAEARNEAAGIVTKANADIERERKRAVNKIKDQISDMAVDIAGKVIGREVSTDEEQDRLIDEFIGELDDDGDK